MLRVVLLAALLVPLASAQTGTPDRFGGGPTADDRLVALDGVLDLTDGQEVAIQAALDRQSAATADAQTLSDREQRVDAARRAAETARAEIEAALTPAQRDAYAAYRAGHQSDRAGRGGGDVADRQLDALRDRLGLSDDQADQLRPVFEAQAEQVRPLVERMRTAESRQDRMAVMRELRAARGAADARVEAVLSADQMLKYRAVQDERREQMRSRRGDGEPGRQDRP